MTRDKQANNIKTSNELISAKLEHLQSNLNDVFKEIELVEQEQQHGCHAQ